MFEVRSLL